MRDIAPIVLADEQVDDLPLIPATTNFEIETAYANRPEIRSLELAAKIYQQKINVTRSEHLPSVALMGNYMVTNPSVFNSFENKFKGMWNVGVMVQLPIWHWGEGIYKVKAAKAEARIAQYQLEDAKEKIELQVNQSAFKVNEAAKKLAMAKKNLEKADENLRYATIGFDTLYADGKDADYEKNPTSYQIKKGLVTYKTKISTDLARSGGFAISLIEGAEKELEDYFNVEEE